MFKTILVGFDGSDHAKNALLVATGLAKTHGATLHVSHSPQMDTPTIVIGSYVSLLDVPPTQDQIDEAGHLVSEAAQALVKKQGVELKKMHLSSGVPANNILAIAEKIDADLIVLGRRGLGAFGALALGSVSQAVSHGAKCACLTVI